MSKAPPIPPDQRAFRGQRPDIHDDREGLKAGHPPKADLNLKQQGQQGNLRQNVHYQQDR